MIRFPVRRYALSCCIAARVAALAPMLACKEAAVALWSSVSHAVLAAVFACMAFVQLGFFIWFAVRAINDDSFGQDVRAAAHASVAGGVLGLLILAGISRAWYSSPVNLLVTEPKIQAIAVASVCALISMQYILARLMPPQGHACTASA